MSKEKKKPLNIEKKEPRFQVLDRDSSYTSGIPQPDPFTDFTDTYAAHVWVYTCVRAIATSIAAVKILPYTRKSGENDEWELNEKHPFFKLLEQPNPYMSGYNLKEFTAASLKLTGNAYWYLEKFGGNEVKEIWPLLPDQVKAIASPKKFIDRYIYTVGGTPTDLEYNEVIHFKSMNPTSMIYGQGAVSAAKITLTTDIFAQIWNKSFFSNAARPDSVLQTDSTLDDDVRKRVMTSWNQMNQGASKHGKTAILEGGLKHARISENVKDMDFVNLRKDLRTEILASFGVPPSVVGVLEYANYSNMEQQLKTFWNQTLLPEIRNIEETITIRARQITFDMKTVFQADLSTVQALQPDMKLMADTTRMFVDSGVPINQVIVALDLPFTAVEGGDVPRGINQAPVVPPAPEPEKAVHAKKLIQSDVREGQWKVFDSFVRQHEKPFEGTMKGYFRGQRMRVLKNLEKIRGSVTNLNFINETKTLEDSISVIFDIEAENTLLGKAAGRHIKGTYFDFAVRTAREVSFDFNLTDAFALSWIKAKELKLSLDVNRYTNELLTESIRDSIQEAIAGGFSEGETIKQITERIEDIYTFATEGRAARIARTEVISASNAGNFEALKQAGVNNKEWLSSRDSLVRETHDQLDGQTVGIGDSFISSSGASLQFPGDPQSDASEIINCRCVVTRGNE